MHPQAQLPQSPAQRSQQAQQKKDQPEEFSQYQKYQEVDDLSSKCNFMYLTSYSNNAGSKIKKTRNPRPRQHHNSPLHWHQYSPTTLAILWILTTITINLSMIAGTTVDMIPGMSQCIDPNPGRASAVAKVTATILISRTGAIIDAISSSNPTIRSKFHLISISSLNSTNPVDLRTTTCGELAISSSAGVLQLF